MTSPTVSVLIPAYNATFLDEALRSARTQTFTDLEIVVTDDCPTDAVGEIVRRHAEEDGRVRYVRNEPALGGRDNYLRGLELAQGTYVKWLNDDDLLAPEALERMVAVLDAHPDVAVVTSHRQPIDATGAWLDDLTVTQRPVIEDARIHGPSMAAQTLRVAMNLIGEPTSVLVRRQDVQAIEPDAFSVAGVRIGWNVDVALYTNLLMTGDLVYLVESLSFFRQHDGQIQRADGALEAMQAAWVEMRTLAAQLGLPIEQQDVRTTPLGLRPWWPVEVQQRILAADEALATNDVDAAVAALTDAVALRPDDRELGLLLARVLRSGDRIDETLELLRTVGREGEGYTPALIMLGDLLLELGELDAASEAFGHASRLNPTINDLRELSERAAQAAAGA